MNKEFKVGDRISYHEDGGVCFGTLTEYFNDGKEERATIKIEDIHRQPTFGEYVIGEGFSVMHRLDCGAWGGDWSIFHD